MLELTASVQQTLLEAITHSAVPWARVVERMFATSTRDKSRTPICQTTAQLFPKPFLFFSDDELLNSMIDYLPAVGVESDLQLLCSEQQDNQLHGIVSYYADLFEEETVAGLARNVEALIELSPSLDLYELHVPEQTSSFPLTRLQVQACVGTVTVSIV